MGKVVASCVLRAIVSQAFEFVPILPVVVKALYVQMSVLFVYLQVVEVPKECAEVLKGKYEISCTAGAVPSPTRPHDDVIIGLYDGEIENAFNKTAVAEQVQLATQRLN